MYEIVKNLYLSSYNDLDQVGSFFVVNCTKDLPMFGRGIRIPIDDRTDENNRLYAMLPEAVTHIDRMLDQNKKVVVHCFAGQQRSAAVVAAWIIHRYPDMTLDHTIKFIKSKKEDAFFDHITFEPALIRWQNKHLCV